MLILAWLIWGQKFRQSGSAKLYRIGLIFVSAKGRIATSFRKTAAIHPMHIIHGAFSSPGALRCGHQGRIRLPGRKPQVRSNAPIAQQWLSFRPGQEAHHTSVKVRLQALGVHTRHKFAAAGLALFGLGGTKAPVQALGYRRLPMVPHRHPIVMRCVVMDPARGDLKSPGKTSGRIPNPPWERKNPRNHLQGFL